MRRRGQGEIQIPRRGLGRSDGGKGVEKELQGELTTQGTFKNYKKYGKIDTLKFDNRKRPGSDQ